MARFARGLAHLLAPVRCILLDFDGPVCNLFRGQLTAAATVDRLAAVVIQSGVCPREQVPATEDSLDVLKFAYDIDPALARRVEIELAEAETEAAVTAPPTRHASEFIRTAVESGRTLAIVSNNSAGAIETYLDAHGLVVDAVIGRADANPAHLKPSPFLLHRAMAALLTEPANCTLIGDSTSDITAALAANVASIGYANTKANLPTLGRAGADVVVDDIRALTRWVRPHTPSP